MKRFAFALIAVLAAPPLWAQEPLTPPPDEGLTLMERGAQLLLRQLFNEISPQLDDMQQGLGDAITALEPMLRDLVLMIGDLSQYEPPVRLPNGDILLRRKPAPPLPPLPLSPGETLDL
jgi:hypothetical protein